MQNQLLFDTQLKTGLWFWNVIGMSAHIVLVADLQYERNCSQSRLRNARTQHLSFSKSMTSVSILGGEVRDIYSVHRFLLLPNIQETPDLLLIWDELLRKATGPSRVSFRKILVIYR